MLVVFAIYSTTCVRAKWQGREAKQLVEATYLVRQKFKSPENLNNGIVTLSCI